VDYLLVFLVVIFVLLKLRLRGTLCVGLLLLSLLYKDFYCL